MKYLSSVILSFVLFCASAIAHANVPADVFVKGVADDVLTIVKKDKDIQNGDQEKIFALAEEKIMPNFNFDHVCRLVLGKNFSKASKEQQDAFQREFDSCYDTEELPEDYQKRLAYFGKSYLGGILPAEHYLPALDEDAEYDSDAEEAAAWIRKIEGIE